MSEKNLIVPRFFNKSTPNVLKSKEAGRPIYDDVEHCEIRFSGNKQTVAVFPAHEVWKMVTNPQTGENEPVTYAMRFNEQYKQFKAGTAQMLSGTPLSELPFLAEAKRMELKALNIHTAEALAALDGQPLKQLGMGGRELKTQAQAYLDKAAGNADVTNLAARIAALEAENASLKAGAPEPEREGNGPSPFQDWEADDIKNWIETNTGERPRGNPNHATLVARADAVNADLAKKKAAA